MSRRLVLGLGTIALVAVVLVVRALLSHDASAKEQQPATAPPTGGATRPSGDRAGGQGGGAPTVQVFVAPAERRDVPVWLDGLGTVTAWQQVTVKTQVDGILSKVLFREGQTVKAGDVVAQIDQRPFLVQLHQAQGAYARDLSAVKNGKVNLDRYKDLAEKKLIAPQQATDQEAVVAQAEGALKIDQAAIESAQLNLDYTQIKAPCDGVAGVRLVDAGNQVHASDATGIVVIAQLDPTAIMITIPQDNLPAVQTALAHGQVSVEAWSRDGAQKLGAGTIYAVDNQINIATGTVRVKAQLANPQRLLWPNEFVKARLLVDTTKNALVVPASAVQRGPQGTFVYQAQEDGTAAQRPIKVAMTTSEIAVISEGLKGGEQVITEGQNQLRPGARISARPAK